MLGLSRSELDFVIESNEIEGVLGADSQHIAALEYVKHHAAKNGKVSKALILTLHDKLMPNRIEGIHVGKFRQQPVFLASGNRKIKEFPPVAVMTKMLTQWVKDFNALDIKTRPAETFWEFHSRFEAIHPFIDGNGRVGRLLWAYDLVRTGVPIRPMLDQFCMRWTVDETTKERKIRLDTFHECRARYYDALQQDDERREKHERIY